MIPLCVGPDGLLQSHLLFYVLAQWSVLCFPRHQTGWLLLPDFVVSAFSTNLCPFDELLRYHLLLEPFGPTSSLLHVLHNSAGPIMITLAILFYNQPSSVLDCEVSPVQPTACAQKAGCILIPQANGAAPNLVCGKELGRQPISSRWEDGCVLWISGAAQVHSF